MAANLKNLILEHLQALRAENAATKASLEEVISRLGRLEVGVASIRREIAFTEETQAEQSLRYDRLNKRVERIEARLELS
jgi:predicted nuclease with TOPRIM domain